MTAPMMPDGGQPAGANADSAPTLKPRYWFPAKRYGWGWGLPSTWQGWLVLVGYIGMQCVMPMLISPAESLTGYLVFVFTITAMLLVICWWKGEPPRWRWG